MATPRTSPPADSPSPHPRQGGNGSRATRRDASYEEEAVVHGPDGQRIFTVLHLPRGAPIGGLVICPPLHAEFLHNYRKEVVLARTLAAEGVAVQRFHYRGSGNSEGEAADATFPSMLEDAFAALALLEERAPGVNTAFLGTRIGGTIAAAAAGRSDRAPLMLWQPVLDVGGYFRELFRAASIRELRRVARAGASAAPRRSQTNLEELETAGQVDILGYAVHRTLYRSLREHPLRDELGDPPRELLLLQLDQAETLKRPYAELASELDAAGFDVRTRAIAADEHWWFSGNPTHASSTLKTVVDETARWLLTKLDGS